jgi:hypothetical protein
MNRLLNCAPGSVSEIMLETAGDGPGELFGYHWNMFVCLPENEKQSFRADGIALFRSPDGNTRNDWMDAEGNLFDITRGDHKSKGKRGQEAYDCCTDK